MGFIYNLFVGSTFLFGVFTPRKSLHEYVPSNYLAFTGDV
ncbi:hypothetical protein cpL1_0468 [Chlamydia pecorum]|uniref:Uncharacterized protein n=1 Tax=Chlamydia pecorum TaxID=85991 RepID=A0AA40PR11_9CHLA|nr:hypothetical protein CpecS_0458 [Chlamydia pecorum VR629]ETF39354.1 hypothetical protein CpecF_0454 [Chlamydia pecorum DBDeUG]ETF40561.1 hypothetical protein CpecA_0455 [Chlamydia pecorum IPTaLE]KTF29257.1 hypothetical protein cpL1_0468 [Chlamydia pecorum]KZN27664.1 hypothetical protein cpL17_0595 [Chlamydia pecorum]